MTQPIPFSHEHHVAGLGIDCRYCHTSVEVSATAGIPPTATCYNCHKLIWKDSPMLEPVRSSFRTGEPIHWTKIHDLPDFAYFDHSIHVAKGVGCAECHGRVDKMALMRSEHALQMRWCIECHRNPEAHLRPKEEVFNMKWKAEDQPSFMRGSETQSWPAIDLTSCSTPATDKRSRREETETDMPGPRPIRMAPVDVDDLDSGERLAERAVHASGKAWKADRSRLVSSLSRKEFPPGGQLE